MCAYLTTTTTTTTTTTVTAVTAATAVTLLMIYVAIGTQDHTPDKCKTKMRAALNSLELWAVNNKMVITEQKCAYLLFSNWTKESSWEGNIVINGCRIAKDPGAVFLGIRFDWNLSFSGHVGRRMSRKKCRNVS